MNVRRYPAYAVKACRVSTLTIHLFLNPTLDGEKFLAPRSKRFASRGKKKISFGTGAV
jgi:hypothetical protein